MALLIRFAVREIRDALSHKSNSNPNRDPNDRHSHNTYDNDPNALQYQTSYDQGYRPSRRERRRQRKQSLRDMTYRPPSHPSRALGTNLASQSVERGFHPSTFDRGYSSSSHDSRHSHIYDNEPRGYSVSGGPAYDYTHSGQTQGLRRQTSAPRQYYAPRDQYQYGELGRHSQDRGYESASEHEEDVAPPPAYQKS